MAVLQCTGAVLASVSILYWKLTSITPLHSPATSLTLVSHICLHSGLIIATQHSPAQLHNSLEIKRFPLRLFVISFHWSLTFLHRYRYIHAFIVLNLSIQFYDVTPLSWYYDVKIGKSNPRLVAADGAAPEPGAGRGAARGGAARPPHQPRPLGGAAAGPAGGGGGAARGGARARPRRDRGLRVRAGRRARGGRHQAARRAQQPAQGGAGGRDGETSIHLTLTEEDSGLHKAKRFQFSPFYAVVPRLRWRRLWI